MKRGLLLIASITMTIVLTGCHHNLCKDGCTSSKASSSNQSAAYGPKIPQGAQPNMYQQAGPPSAAVAYPYYTTRAPRDFLLANPPSIGY